MFDPWCPTCQRRVLLGTRRIVRLRRDEDGRLHLDLRCFCGTVIGSASTAVEPQVHPEPLAASAAPAGPDAPRPRPAEDASPPPAAAGRSLPVVA